MSARLGIPKSSTAPEGRGPNEARTRPLAALAARFRLGRVGPVEAATLALALAEHGRAGGKAVLEFLHAVRRMHPDAPEVLAALARAQRAAGLEAEARVSEQAAAELSLQRAGSLEDRLASARVLLTAGRPSEAEIELRAALEIAPEHPDALSLLGRVHHMRGELSGAIECWQSVRARSAHNETALFQIGLLHRLAQSQVGTPATASFVQALPASARQLPHAEIVMALRLWIEGHPSECLASLERIAARERTHDPATYKLAQIARAWAQDALGMTRAACATLESMGEESDFATDVERLLFLARLYARSDDPSMLSRAIRVCHYLEPRFEKISLASTLATLYERAGNQAAAWRYRRRFREAFVRRMGHPSLDEFLRGATTHPIGLDGFARFEFAGAELEARARAERSSLSRALLLLLMGDEDAAREALEAMCAEGKASASAWAYLGQLRAKAGDAEGALRAYASALERDPPDHALRAILRLALAPDPSAPLTGSESARGLRAYFAPPARRRRALDALRQALKNDPYDTRTWRALAAFEHALGMRDEAARHEARAEALERAHGCGSAHVGHVQSAAAYYLLGRPKGIIHELWAGRYLAPRGEGGRIDDADVLGNVAPDLRALVRNVCESALVYVQRRFPHQATDVDRYRYTFKVTKEDEPSRGASAGLAAALAFVSCALGLAVPQDLAVTGAVVTDASHTLAVRRVGDVEHKIAGALHKGLRRIVVPADNRPDVESSSVVPPEISARVVVYVRSLDEAIEAVFGPTIWDL